MSLQQNRSANSLHADPSGVTLNTRVEMVSDGITQKLDAYTRYVCPQSIWPAEIQAHYDAFIKFVQDCQLDDLRKTSAVPESDPNKGQYGDDYPGLTIDIA